jgi:hypothetical protein
MIIRTGGENVCAPNTESRAGDFGAAAATSSCLLSTKTYAHKFLHAFRVPLASGLPPLIRRGILVHLFGRLQRVGQTGRQTDPPRPTPFAGWSTASSKQLHELVICPGGWVGPEIG